MKLLGIAFFFLAVFCVCTVGEGGNSANIVNADTSASTSKSVVEAVSTSTSTTTLQASVLTTTAIRATNESITSNSMLSSPNATQQTTKGTTTQPPAKVTATTATSKSESTMSTTQANGTQLAQNESLVASSTKGWLLSSTISLQKTTSVPGTSGLNVSSLTESTSQSSVPTGKKASDNTEGDSGKQAVPESAIHYSSVILPIVITLIVITLSVFLLVALYRMCQKKTPERQENGTEQAQSDKEGVKLLSVKTTSPETGEHSSQGKSKTRQLFTPQQ
ncbi:endomucin [Chlamydotis macqueenii]